MKRQDIQLLAQARQGDLRARSELGRRYLMGSEGFARHVPTALEYLRPVAQQDPEAAATILVAGLALHELVEAGETDALARVAQRGDPLAQLRYGAWRCMQPDGLVEGLRLLAAAAEAGLPMAQRLAQALRGTPLERRIAVMLRLLDAAGLADGRALLRGLVAQAEQAHDLAQRVATINAQQEFDEHLDAARATGVVAAVLLAREQSLPLHGLAAPLLREALEISAAQGHGEAAYMLGQALCGLPVAGLGDEVFAGHENIRKGAAFLVRAVDAGVQEAWLHLHRLHADHHLSVANPSMARFCLEKAAQAGLAEGQRKLGALMLREATDIAGSEQAIHWLQQAAQQGDAHAERLLRSLVLPRQGSDAEAAWALSLVRAADPWLAARLELARHFGLSKLEALSVDPAEGLRPWGLVVGRNPFVTQVRLQAPRAVPALDAAAQHAAERAAALFAQSQGAREGDLRNRSLRQRRLFERLRLDEALFFADASAAMLDSLRVGSKWAHRERRPLNEALAA